MQNTPQTMNITSTLVWNKKLGNSTISFQAKVEKLIPNHLKHLFINGITWQQVSALKTSLLLPTLPKENLFCYKNQSYFFCINEMRVLLFMKFALFFNQMLPSITDLCNFKVTCQNPYFSPEKEKRSQLSLNDDCSYNSLFLTQYWRGKLIC